MSRLLVLTPTLSPETGWGQYADSIVTHLRNRYELEVLTELPDVTTLRSSPKSLLSTVRTVRRRLSSVDGVLCLVSYPYSLVAYLATRRTDIPYFVTCHGTYAVEPLFNKHHIPARRSFSKASALFAVSSFTADKMRERMRACNVYVIPNGVSGGSPEVEPFDVDHRVILTVGAFKSRKGQLFAIESFAQITEEVSDVNLHLVGDDGSSYAERVRARVAELGIENRVHFEGQVPEDELNRWYATADAFLLTPKYEDHHFEGFGLVYLEANRFGVPVIGTYGTGAEDAIAQGTSGFYVATETGAVADAIRRLFTDDDLHRQLSEGAKRWADTHTWLRTTEQMATIMDRRIKER